MKFVIRDDDVNYFSTPADIERWYADMFAEGVPVAFSAIPYVSPASDVYPFYPKETARVVEEREYPIGDNQELVNYMKDNPLIEVLQHGTTHETHDGIYEYQAPVARKETLRGREELERAFGTSVSLFVPPHDWIGTSGVYSVEAAGQDIIRGRGAGLRNFIPRLAYLFNFLHMLLYKCFHALTGRVPAYPYVLDFGRHRELCSYRLEDADVFAGLEYAHAKDGIFVVVTHLHFYTEEKKKILLELIKKGRELGAEFVKPSSLFA